MPQQFVEKLDCFLGNDTLKILLDDGIDPFLAEIEAHLDGINLRELMQKETDQLISELDEYLFATTEDDCSAEKVAIYMAVLQEKDPITVEIDAEAINRKIQARLADIVGVNFPKTSSRSWRSKLAVGVACVICVFVLVTATAYACGVNVFSYFIQWGEELFIIGRMQPSGAMELPSDAVGAGVQYISLADALEKNEVSSANIPKWIPTRFSFTEVVVAALRSNVIFDANYFSGETDLFITVNVKDMLGSDTIVEKDSGGSTYIKGGVEHYLFLNMGVPTAVWADERCYYTVYGDVITEELQTIIDSIYK